MQQDRRSANHLRENYRIVFEVVQTKRHTTHKRLVLTLITGVRGNIEREQSAVVPMSFELAPFSVSVQMVQGERYWLALKLRALSHW